METKEQRTARKCLGGVEHYALLNNWNVQTAARLYGPNAN
jgi:hypothetical protein